jgi:hypothetical protein
MAWRSVAGVNIRRVWQVVPRLLPFLAFYCATIVTPMFAALLIGLLTALVMSVRDMTEHQRQLPTLMDTGTILTFAGLLAYFGVVGHAWSLPMVRLTVHFSLLRLALFSILIRRPFTHIYARDHVAPELWSDPDFRRRGYVVTLAWGVAFGMMVAADVTQMVFPALPGGFVTGVTMAALAGALWFTCRDPLPLPRTASST